MPESVAAQPERTTARTAIARRCTPVTVGHGNRRVWLDRKLSIKCSDVVSPPDLTTLTLLLGRLGRLNELLVNSICAEHGTSAAELRVLLFLTQQPTGAASPRHVARFVVQTTGGLTATLGRLETAGLVERRPDPNDGRGKIVSITAAGRDLHDRALDSIVARTGETIRGIDLTQLDLVVRSLVGSFEQSVGLPSTRDFVAVPTESRITA